MSLDHREARERVHRRHRSSADYFGGLLERADAMAQRSAA